MSLPGTMAPRARPASAVSDGLSVGIVCDLLEERWLSMDLVADMLLDRLESEYAGEIRARRIRPEFARRFQRAPGFGGTARAFNADRLLHRFWDYPQFLRTSLRAGDQRCDVYHVMDHSYAQLVHELPADRTVVACHDLDAFRSIVDPARDRRSKPFRAMTARILSGLRKAAYITCDSEATRQELLGYGVARKERTGVVPNGVDRTCSPKPDAAADREASRLLDSNARGENAIDLLHVGSTIPRKRIDILLRIFAAIARDWPGRPGDVRLIRVGGPFTPAQRELARELGVEDSILVLPFLDRAVVAAVYRRAALVLLPSGTEGFGLPVIESLACGTPVIASDLAVLREAGGDCAVYCPPENIAVWAKTAIDLLRERVSRPDLWEARRLDGMRQAALFSWSEYAHRVVAIYRCLANSAVKDKCEFPW